MNDKELLTVEENVQSQKTEELNVLENLGKLKIHNFNFFKKFRIDKETIQILDFHPKQKEKLLQFISDSLFKLSLKEPKANPVIEIFQKLADLDDKLILLILENIAIDVKLHGMTFECINFQSNADRCFKFGEFDALERALKFSITPFLFNTFIHELTHACVSFTFRPQNIAGKLASVPHDQHNTVFKNSKAKFNPAELKFKQCVREDYQKQKTADMSGFLFSPTIDLQSHDCSMRCLDLRFSLKDFFTKIEESYKSGIFDEVALAEIFSHYMEIRANLMQFAKDYNIEKKEAMKILAKHLPRLHDYFETDIKRVLGHRLRYFIESHALYSRYDSLNFSASSFSNINSPDLNYDRDISQIVRGFVPDVFLRSQGYMQPNVSTENLESDVCLNGPKTP